MSELTTDLDWWALTRYPSTDDDWSPSAGGRHAYDEDAALTPIFHALTSSGRRRRQPEPPPARGSAPAHPGLPARSAAPVRPSRRRSAPDAVDAFRRDPLTMPIPQQAGEYVEAARRAAFGAHELRAEREQPARGDRPGVSDTGRHHRTRSSIGSLL